MIIFGAFFVACSNTPKLFAPVNHPLDAVTLTITVSIKRPTTALMGFAWDDCADAAPPQPTPDLPIAIRLSPTTRRAPDPRAIPTVTLDRPADHQGFKGGGLMALSSREHHLHQSTLALDADVDFGAEAALTAT